MVVLSLCCWSRMGFAYAVAGGPTLLRVMKCRGSEGRGEVVEIWLIVFTTILILPFDTRNHA